MIEALTAPWAFPFMRDAALILILIAPAAALLSCLLVLKGWALMGDAVSHAVLPGIVLAYIAGVPLLLGAFVAGLGTALATGYVRDNSRIKQDTAMGVIFAGMFGLGIVLYTWTPSDLHLDHILFGDMLGLTAGDLWTAGLIAVPVAAVLLLRWRDLLAQAFDPVQATMTGLPVTAMHYGLLAALSAVIVAMLAAVGIILSIALLIAPGALGFLTARTYPGMMAVAVAGALASALAGLWASFWIDSAPAPTVVLALMVLTLMALARRLWRTRRAVAALS